MIFTAIMFFGCIALKCVPTNTHKCRARPEIINLNSNERLFYPYSIQ